MEKQRRVPALTGLRTLASTSVALTHAFTMLLAAGYVAPAHFTARGAWFFFILSGYLYRKPAGLRRYAEYLRRRFARLLPLHLLVLVFFVITGFTLNTADRPSVVELFMNVTLTQEWVVPAVTSIHVPTWSLSVEMFFVIFFPIAAFIIGIVANRVRLRTGATGRQQAFPIAVQSFLVALVLLAAASPLPIPRAIRDIPFFLVGMATQRLAHTDRWRPRSLPLTGLVVMATVIGLSQLWTADVTAWGFVAARVAVGVGYAVVILNLSSRNAKPSRVADMLARPLFTATGSASYSYYILHTAVLTSLGMGLERLHPPAPLAYLLTLTVLVTTWGMALAVHHAVELPLAERLSRSTG